jgi:cation transport ATPase
VSITDDDLFPAGTVTLGGIKIFEEVSPEKALRYTASLIIASNSGLSKLFSEQIGRNGLNLIRVEDFTIYEGGIGGKIRGEHAIVGSAAFMNLMGIRIPASLNMKNAIFTAVNKKLIAVFAVNYVPVKSVQNALMSILRYRVKLFFAMRDFNITPVMLEQKYKIPVDDVEYIPIRDSYDISDATKHEAKRVSAVLTRDGLGPYAEAITGGRRLRTTSLVATIFSLFSAVFGMLLMFVICWTGAYASASASNLMLYMLSMLLVVLIIAGFAKFRQ